MNTKLTLLLLFFVALIAGLIVTAKFYGEDSNRPYSTSSSTESVTQNDETITDIALTSKESPTGSTIKQHWQWSDLSKNGNQQEDDLSEPTAPPLFTAQTVHDALYAVKLDEDKNLILDNDALVSLDEALEGIYHKLDEHSLLELTDLIESALPGETGVETATLVKNYHGFLVAQDAFNQMHSSAPGAQGVQSIASIEYDQNLYTQLQGLRSLHLGEDAANRLFHESDVNSEYMFESIKLSMDESISEQERLSRRQALEERRLAALDLGQ